MGVVVVVLWLVMGVVVMDFMGFFFSFFSNGSDGGGW